MKKFILLFFLVSFNLAAVENCLDSLDNDSDTLVDCNDPDCSLSCSNCGANVIVNGSFELSTSNPINWLNVYPNINPNDIDGWTVTNEGTSNNCDVLKFNVTAWPGTAVDGDFVLDLFSWSNAGTCHGNTYMDQGIKQLVPTEVGSTYDLTYHIFNIFTDPNIFSTSDSVKVYVNGSLAQDISPIPHNNSIVQTYRFTAVSTATEIKFVNRYDQNSSVNLDNVKVTKVCSSFDAINDLATVSKNSVNNIIKWNINDIIPSGVTLNSFDSTSINGGTILNNGDGSFKYTPATGFTGSDTFNYTLCDDSAIPVCDTATITINIILDNDNDLIEDSIDLDDDNDGILDSIEGAIDSDHDGIPNNLDLDSDNDGILDVIEAGGSDTNNDGINDNFIDLNNDGLSDVLITLPLPGIDSDNDGKRDFLDIDSDNDGATDTIEAQSTNNFIPPSGIDSDNDGIDNSFDVNGGHPLIRIDTDQDGVPDVIDTDTDNDGILDIVEANDNNKDGINDTPYIGIDTDNDGLDDAFDTDNTSLNPFLNTIKTSSPLPNYDSIGDKDWRDVGGATCTDLKPTMVKIDGSFAQLSLVATKILQLSRNLTTSNKCSLLTKAKYNNLISKINLLHSSGWQKTWTLPTTNFNNCATVIDTCSIIDNTSSIQLLNSYVESINNQVKTLISGKCITRKSRLAKLLKSKLISSYSGAKNNISSYPNSVLKCG